ncbi:MAG: hypothetical protein IPM64_01865 [Phycisphaerales bacterium]|nr:hypothetical protein [Phycisphaerales bacterium]
METAGGMLSRMIERTIGWVILAALVGLGVLIWQMSPETRSAIIGGIWRSIAWLLLAAATPWAAALVIRRVLSAGSNAAGFGLLAALSLVNILTGVALLTGWPTGAWGWSAAVGALLASGTYNFLVAQYLAERAGQ